MSIVVPVHSGIGRLREFMDALAAQAPAEPVEVLLVDEADSGYISESAQQLCSDYAPLFDSTVVKLAGAIEPGAETTSRHTAFARQVGAALSRAEHVLFLSPAYELGAGCLDQHLWLKGQGFEVVLGPVLPAVQSEINGVLARQRAWRRHMSAVQSSPAWWKFFSFSNASISRALFHSVGGLDSALQFSRLYEKNFAYRLGKAGARFWHTIRACVTSAEPEPSASSLTLEAKEKQAWLPMEVLFRKYLDDSIIEAYSFLWDTPPEPPATAVSKWGI